MSTPSLFHLSARPAASRLFPLFPLLLSLLLIGCSSLATSKPDVFFVSPVDGASVSSPVKIELGADQFTVEPAGDGAVHPNAGHLHLMIDVPCLAPGETIPKDENHRHFGDGSTSAEVELASGRHTLCLQAADGGHTALAGLQQSITIEVE